MTSSKPWADTPFPLLETPSRTRPLATSHYSVNIASEMTHAHNSFLRTLNSIYNQATHLPSPKEDPAVVKDFLFFCRCWFDVIEHHHAGEERVFFPAVEKLAGKPGLMEGNVKQHEAFHTGVFKLRDYAISCTVEEYDGAEVQRIIDSFAKPLTRHLGEEVETLLQLDALDEEELKKGWKELEAYALNSDKYTLFPFVLGAIDNEYEGGIHKGVFPPVPWFVPYLVKYWYERRYAGAWRFSPCDGFGNRRGLLYV